MKKREHRKKNLQAKELTHTYLQRKKQANKRKRKKIERKRALKQKL